MRIPLMALAMCMIADLLLPAPAAAAGRPARGGLSAAPVVARERLSCKVPAIRAGSAASLKSFHRAMAACADRFWAGRFAAAGLTYTPPEVTVTTGGDSVCGRITVNGAQYCPAQRTIVIRIMKHDLNDPFRMNVAHSVAHEWGHHVQQLTGVLDAQNALYWPASTGARTVLSHRLEMQAECFAGVFYSAALTSIRPDVSWRDWLDAVRRADYSKIHGRPRNLAYWQNRGYREGTTAACDTWTAAKDRVR
ncbi:neutral zinc metallopeptidase [Nonomuraea sp. NPDC052265]|uniref:neutral zinc metallopeptidase n=1 Tax=Nonomuraea sp. NPDC052265 TaxID=3364374 RepID=UPI0037C8F3BE